MAEHERTKKHEAASSEYAAKEARRTFQSQWNLSSCAQLLKYQIPVTYVPRPLNLPSTQAGNGTYSTIFDIEGCPIWPSADADNDLDSDDMFDDDEPVPAETFMTQEQRPAYFDNMELAQQELEIEQEITEGTGNVNYGLLPRPFLTQHHLERLELVMFFQEGDGYRRRPESTQLRCKLAMRTGRLGTQSL